MDRHQLVLALQQYQSDFKEEKSFLVEFLQLLGHKDCYERTHLPGHLTGSAWITDPTRKHVVLVHHARLNKWMQPGGHADGDENILRVALKEAEEETGLVNLKVLSHAPFDIDIHTIPQRPDFPEHLHFDIRFLLEAKTTEPIIVSHESHDVKWVSLKDLEKFTQSKSVTRMKEKLLRSNQH
jgi:8-oxo-dGTP pyrophosphatase MutT (NUDIX family)